MWSAMSQMPIIRSSLSGNALVFLKKIISIVPLFHGPLPNRPYLFYCSIVVLLKSIPTHTHTHTHKTTFLEIILLIEFCRLTGQLPGLYGTVLPGMGTPGQFFGKYLKLHWLSNHPIKRSAARLEGPKKEGLK